MNSLEKSCNEIQGMKADNWEYEKETYTDNKIKLQKCEIAHSKIIN